MADATFTLGIEGEGEEQLARDIESTLSRAFKGLGKDLSDSIRKALGGETVTRSASKSAKATEESFRKAFQSLESQRRLFERRMEAMARNFGKIGFDAGDVSSFADGLERLSNLNRSTAANVDALARSEQHLNAVRVVGRNLSSQQFADLGLLQSEIKAITRAEGDRARATQQSERLAAQALKQQSSERIVTMQTEAARSTTLTRAAAQRRVEIIRAAANQIRALERGLGAVFRSTASAISASFRGISRTIGTALSGLGRGNRQMVSGLSPALNRRERLLSSSFRRQEQIINTSVSRQTQTVQRFERVLSTGVLGAATGRSATAGALGFGGAVAGAGLGVGLLTSGFERFSNLERLTKQFTALTGSVEQATFLLDQAKEFAKTTPFDVIGVSDLAKGFLAIGTAVEDVMPRVRTIADAVALTGGGTDELVRIQRAIGQVVSAGRLQGDELNQLAENLPGLNIRKILADQLTGGNQAALVEMQEAGEISSEMFVNGIITGLSTDPRLVGAAEDLANTLKGRFDNLKESFADVGAALIGAIAEPMKLVFRGLNAGFSGIAQFIRGENLSKSLDTLRTAAQGAAVAIGGLIVAKVAGQALQILALGVRALLTPMGLLVGIVAGIGATIAILRDRSIPFREATDRIVDRIGELASGIGGFLLDRLTDFADFLGTTVLPAVESFGAALAERVIPAAEAVGQFFTETIIPALETFGRFLLDTLVPAVRNGLVRGFEIAKDAITDFWDAAQPILQPAIDGITQLGEAIAGIELTKGLQSIGAILASTFAGFAVGGPVGALVGGVGATVAAAFYTGFGDELISGLSSVGSLIVDGLRTGLGSVQGLLGRIFTVDNLIDASAFALGIIERLGFILGNIASDPRLVAAIAGLVGFGALAALRFIEGFGRGIISNVPELGSMIGDGLKAAFEGALRSLTNIDLVTNLLGGVFLGAVALSAWRRAGQAAGQQAGRGLTAGLRAGMAGGAFAGGGTGTRTARGSFFTALFNPSDIDRQAAMASARVNTAARRITEGMRSTLRAAGQTDVDLLQTSQIRRRFDELATQIGPSGIAGLRIRSAFQATFRALADRSFLPVRELSAMFAATGQSLGRTLATSIIGAVGGAAAGLQVGQALGGASGLQQALGLGGLVAGLAAISGPAAIAAGAVGLVGIAMGNAAADAERAARETNEYADALRDLDGAERGMAAVDIVMQNLRDETNETRDVLIAAGFDIGDFGERVVSGTTNARGEFQRLVSTFGDGGRRLSSALSGLDEVTGETFANLVATTDVGKDFSAAVSEMGLSATDFIDVLDFLQDESGELRGALRVLSQEESLRKLSGDAELSEEHLTALADAFAAIRDKAGEADLTTLGEGFSEFANLVQEEMGKAREAVDGFLQGDFQGGFEDAASELIVGLPALGQQIADAITTGGVIGEAQNTQIGEAINADIRNAISRGLTSGDIAPTPEAVTAALQGLSDRISQAAQSGQITPEVAFAVNTRISEILNSGDIPTLIQNLLTAGLISTATIDVPVSVNPIISVPTDRGDEIKEQIERQLSAGRSPGSGPQGFTSAGGGGGGIQVDVPVSVNPDVKVNTKQLAVVGKQIPQALAAGIASGIGLVVGAIRSVAAAASAVKVDAGSAYSAGLQVAAGLAAGIRAGAGGAIQAARNMANSIIAITQSALKIKSPSKVFIDIGTEVGRGFAEGIHNSEQSMISAVSGAVNNAIEAALDAAGRHRGALAAGIFDALDQVNTAPGRNVASLIGELQQIPIRFVGANEQLGVDIWNAAVAQAQGEFLTADRRALLTQNFLDLNQGTVAGARNSAAFLEEGARIREFISASLQGGADINSTVAQAAGFRELLANTLRARRVDADDFMEGDIQNLIRSLGLADDQLGAFVQQVNAAATEAQRAAVELNALAAAEAARAAAEEAADRAQQLEIERLREELRLAGLMVRPIEVNLALPYGDPEAVGLATANRLAMQLAG